MQLIECCGFYKWQFTSDQYSFHKSIAVEPIAKFAISRGVLEKIQGSNCLHSSSYFFSILDGIIQLIPRKLAILYIWCYLTIYKSITMQSTSKFDIEKDCIMGTAMASGITSDVNAHCGLWEAEESFFLDVELIWTYSMHKVHI